MLQTDLVETRQRLLRLVEGPPGSGEQEEQPEQAQQPAEQVHSQQGGGDEEQQEVDDDELMQMHAEAMMVGAGLPGPGWLRSCPAHASSLPVMDAAVGCQTTLPPAEGCKAVKCHALMQHALLTSSPAPCCCTLAMTHHHSPPRPHPEPSSLQMPCRRSCLSSSAGHQFPLPGLSPCRVLPVLCRRLHCRLCQM